MQVRAGPYEIKRRCEERGGQRTREEERIKVLAF